MQLISQSIFLRFYILKTDCYQDLLKVIFSFSWRQLFEELDKDKSGSIEVEELKNFIKDANMESLIPVLDDWIADYDVNKDGKLQYKEFLGFIATIED